mmetsp:Transcript_40543/g.50001  ORF Transcript_40543/g.50001 Transcript_40543/m.50001 type:complete len:119 (+) Transcript_40543:91-447(+)
MQLVWFWVFSCIITPIMLATSAFSLIQFRNILILIVNIKTKEIPKAFSFIKPVITSLRSVITQAFGNPRQYKPSWTHVLLFALIVAVLCLLPVLWELIDTMKERSVVQTTSKSTKKSK